MIRQYNLLAIEFDEQRGLVSTLLKNFPFKDKTEQAEKDLPFYCTSLRAPFRLSGLQTTQIQQPNQFKHAC